MYAHETANQYTTTDILVVGGGPAGLMAALAAKEADPAVNVTIIDKATTGLGGKAVRKSGGLVCFGGSSEKTARLLEFYTPNNGGYLCDQELLAKWSNMGPDVMERFFSWGPRKVLAEDGSMVTLSMMGTPEKNPLHPFLTTAVDLDFGERMRVTAEKRGIAMIDKVSIVDLLKDGDRVAGAIGFNIIDGTCQIFKAKAVILANGNQNFRHMPKWSSARGDGIAAAYRAGAEMRNAEFGNFYMMGFAATSDMGMTAPNFMYNAKGESIAHKCVPNPERGPKMITMTWILGWYEEMMAGNGPIYSAHKWGEAMPLVAPTSGRGSVSRANHDDWRKLEYTKIPSAFDDLTKVEVRPGFVADLGPVKVDHDMSTTVPGLYAVGDISYTGSCMMGAHPAPGGALGGGTGIGFALFSGYVAGPAAVKYILGAEELKVSNDQVSALKSQMFAPLERKDGVDPMEIVRDIQAAVSPIKYSLARSEGRLKEALEMLEKAEAKLPNMVAKDTHYLAVCNEARSMVLSAQLMHLSALERKESRGFQYLEEYPETDNENWLKWIVLKDKNGVMNVSTENIPIDKYPVKL